MTTVKKSDIDLDLDALAPKVIQINYKGKLIKVEPLDLEQFARYFELAEKMSKLKDSPDTNAVIAAIKEVEAYIKSVIPDFKDDKLNQVQITAIFALLGELNQTQDKAIDELKARGIELKKGAQSQTSPKGSTS